MEKAPSSTIRMIRETLADIPQFALPDKFFIRCFREGDEESWVRILLQSDKHNPISSTLFSQ